MGKTYDIGDSAQVSKLRNSTIGVRDPSNVGAIKKGSTKPTLADQIFPSTKKWPDHMPAGDDMSGPGQGESYISQHLSDLGGPTNSQGVFDAGGFKNPTAAENFYNQNGAAMAAPGPSSSYYNQNASQYQTPGAAENWFAGHSGQFDKPGAAEDFYSAHKGDLANMPGLSNHAEEAYQHTRGNMPDIASDPGLDPYYKHAAQVGTQNLNTQLAARGAYGSSVGTGQIGNLLQGLGAEQANREAQYHLDRLAEQRGWEGLQGQLASGADSSSGRIHDAKLGDLLGFGNLAQNAGASSLSRLLGASGAASAAQGAQTARLNSGASAANMADTTQTNRLNSAANAAGTASQSDLARQGLSLQAAGQADSQNRGNFQASATAAGLLDETRSGRLRGGLSDYIGAVDRVNSVVSREQAAMITNDQSIVDGLSQLDLATASEVVRQADAKAARNTERWSQIAGGLITGALSSRGGGKGGAFAAGAKAGGIDYQGGV